MIFVSKYGKYSKLLPLVFLVTAFCFTECLMAQQSAAWIDYQDALSLEKTSPEKAYLKSYEALQKAEIEEDESLQAEIYHLLGTIFYDQGAFTQALEYYLQAERIYISLQDDAEVAHNRIALGKVYHYIKQEARARELFDLAKSHYEKSDGQKPLAMVYGEIGHLFEKASQYDSAMIYQDLALEVYSRLQDSAGMAVIYENIGSILEDQEDFEKARFYFKSAAQINEQLNNMVPWVSNINNVGDTYRKVNVLDSALYYSKKASFMAHQLELRYQESSALRDLGKIYFLMGHTAEAYDYEEQSRVLYEEVYSQESSRQMALLQTLYDVERKNSEISALENEKRIEKLNRNAMVAAAFGFLLIGGVVVSRQRLKIRNDRVLIEQKEELHRSAIENSELQASKLQVELDHKKLQEEHLNLELEGQQRALAARMLQLIEKNKLLEDLRNDIIAFEAEVPQKSKAEVKQLVNRINYSFNHDKSWEDFRKSFEQIHGDFFEKLKKSGHDLTSNDLRICALIRINLSSKDISSLLGISTDSLRVARYRLRKKLNIDQGENLRKFILSV